MKVSLPFILHLAAFILSLSPLSLFALEALAELFRAAAQREPVLENLRLVEPDREPLGHLRLLLALALDDLRVARDHLRAPLALDRGGQHAPHALAVAVARELLAKVLQTSYRRGRLVEVRELH